MSERGQGVHHLLPRRKAENEAGLKSNFIFPHRDGARLKETFREQPKCLARRAKISDLTELHSLGHPFASNLVMSGVDLPTVQKLMGYFESSTTVIDAHPAADHLVEAVDRLQLIGIVTGNPRPPRIFVRYTECCER